MPTTTIETVGITKISRIWSVGSIAIVVVFFISSEPIDENHCCHHDLDDDDGVDRLGEEHEWATTELRNSLRSIEWDLEDLEDTVQVVQDHANHANLDDQ